MRVVRPVLSRRLVPPFAVHRRAARVAAWLAPLLLLVVLGGSRWADQGPLPSGVDGGQWLALGRGLLGEGRITAGAYPPLVPALLHGLALTVGPIDAVRGAAIGSLLAIPATFFLVARSGLGAPLALALTATLGIASAVTEPSAYGGYPQQLAFALLLLASWTLARYLSGGDRRWLIAGAGTLLAAALTHHVYFPLALLTAGAVWLVWLTTRPARRLLGGRSLAVAAAAGVGLLGFVPSALRFRAAGYSPPLDVSGWSMAEAFRYGTREAPLLWLIVIVAGFCSLAATTPRRRSPVWQVAVGLLGVAAALFAVTAEARLLPPVLAGALLALGIGLRSLAERARGTAGATLPLLVAASLPLLLWPGAARQAEAYFAYYRVVDPSLLAAAAVVDQEAGAGTVVVRANRRGWPVGWWFEGLTDAHIVAGADERWLGFPEERAGAALAARFFAPGLEGDELVALAADTGVELLAFRKWEWIGWQRWLEEDDPVVRVVYDDDRFLVLAIRSPATRS